MNESVLCNVTRVLTVENPLLPQVFSLRCRSAGAFVKRGGRWRVFNGMCLFNGMCSTNIAGRWTTSREDFDQLHYLAGDD